MKLIITGVSCVGKSTVGKMLAEKLDHFFFDFDFEVEAYFNSHITFIKNECSSEKEYRKKAAEVLGHILNQNKKDFIIAMPPSGLKDYYWKLIKDDPDITTVVLRDRAANIVKRLTFYNDYSELDESPVTVHNKHLYEKEVSEDMKYFGFSFRKADIKFDINGRDPKGVVDELHEQLALFEEESKQKQVEEETVKQKEVSDLIPSITEEFDRFVDYLRTNDIQLTKKKKHISRSYLPAINQLLTVQNDSATSYTEQKSYLYIHLLFTLAVNGKLFRQEVGPKGRLYIRPTDKLNQYTELNDLEKYYFLLETLWVDTNWSDLLKRRNLNIGHFVQDMFAEVSAKLKNGGSFFVRRSQPEHFVDYFRWFGIWEEADEIEYKEFEDPSFYESHIILKLTALNSKLIRRLLIERNLQLWNIPERKLNGELNPIPGSPPNLLLLPLSDKKVIKKVEYLSLEDHSSETFHEPFKKLYPKGALKNALPRLQQAFKKGIYSFKVSLSKSIWRELTFSADHTMEELHRMIISSFDMDDDHLYAFFMDGEPWSEESIMSPLAEDRISANVVKIGELGLEELQSFLYMFDFGDEWLFDVKVTEIREQDHALVKPFIKASRGALFRQFEDDFEDY